MFSITLNNFVRVSLFLMTHRHLFFFLSPVSNNSRTLYTSRSNDASFRRLLSENRLREVHNKMFTGLTNLKTLWVETFIAVHKTVSLGGLYPSNFIFTGTFTGTLLPALCRALSMDCHTYVLCEYPLWQRLPSWIDRSRLRFSTGLPATSFMLVSLLFWNTPCHFPNERSRSRHSFF